MGKEGVFPPIHELVKSGNICVGGINHSSLKLVQGGNLDKRGVFPPLYTKGGNTRFPTCAVAETVNDPTVKNSCRSRQSTAVLTWSTPLTIVSFTVLGNTDDQIL